MVRTNRSNKGGHPLPASLMAHILAGLCRLARRLPTFFHRSTSVRTEACSSDPPVVFPSATQHVFLWFFLKQAQECDNPFQKLWIEEKTPSTACAYVCAYDRSRHVQKMIYVAD